MESTRRRNECCRDAVPFTVMVALECLRVATNTLFKAATLRGMSYHVFLVYSNAVASIILLPSLFTNRSAGLPPLSFSILSKMALLGLIGGTAQILGYAGIVYSSPALASAMSNLTPAFTFLLAITLRMERLALRSSISQAKLSGTIVSISGALAVSLYQGPPISLAKSSASLLQQPRYLHSPESSWVIGSILLSIEYSLAAVWFIILAQIMKEYPAEMTVMFFCNTFVGILCLVVGLITEPEWDAWRIGFDIKLASVLCSGVFVSFLSSIGHTWVVHLKGPVYVTMFKPLSIAIAVAMGVTLLGDILYLGSVIGAVIICIGFYTVMWGKSKEHLIEESLGNDLGSLSTQRVPLLQNSIP